MHEHQANKLLPEQKIQYAKETTTIEVGKEEELEVVKEKGVNCPRRYQNKILSSVILRLWMKRRMIQRASLRKRRRILYFFNLDFVIKCLQKVILRKYYTKANCWTLYVYITYFTTLVLAPLSRLSLLSNLFQRWTTSTTKNPYTQSIIKLL